MKGSIPDDKIEEIKKRTDIVALISEYVTLKKAGRNFLGICPFHKEKTPSFTVNREKQMYYCFGCGEGGHVFTFLTKMGNMTFPEAARHLAKKSGIVIPERTMSRREKLQYGVSEQIIRINEAAAGFFERNLISAAGRAARDYLKERGIGDDAVREFRLGYADSGWRTLRDFFEEKRFPLNVAAQAGLVVSRNDAGGARGEDFYDRFRERLIFPIEDAGGRIIAFGGRIIGPGEPKYLNSPETPVFSKGKNLYGLKMAKESIRNKGCVVLVEGYIDLISLWNAGIANVVATLGTALTREQVDLLRRYAERVIVLFDPDEAGRKALERSLRIFLAGGVQAKTVVLPEGYDPDAYVRRYGGKSLEEIMAGAPSLVDYYIENIVGAGDSLEAKRDAVRDALAFVSDLDDAIERNLFLKRISEKLGIDLEVLKKEATRVPHASSPRAPATVEKTGEEHDKVEFSLIIAMVEHPANIGQVEEAGVLDYFISKELKSLGNELILFSKSASNPGALSLQDSLPDGPLKKKILRALLEGETGDTETINRYLSDAIKQIKRKWRKRRSKALMKDLVDAQEKGDADLCSRLLLEKAKILKEEKLI